MQSLKTENIYAYNILKASKVNFDETHSYLFSSLLNLENRSENNDLPLVNIAEELLKIIRNTDAFRDIDRVCITLTNSNSHKLSILSSANSTKLSDSDLVPGYSCFVQKNSSIFKTKNSSIRVYGDIDEIVSLYDNNPVQRSLWKLKEMGVKSGITIPLRLSDMISGFLFLNSANIGEFDYLRPVDYTVLCTLRLIVTGCIVQNLKVRTGLGSRAEKYLLSLSQKTNMFVSSEFENSLKEAIKVRFFKDIELEIDNTVGSEFYLSNSQVIYTLLMYLENLLTIPNKIKVVFEQIKEENKELLVCRFKDIPIDYSLEDINVLNFYSFVDISLDESDFVMKLNFDKASEVGYSI